MSGDGGAERHRLCETDEGGARWRRWGPYLSEWPRSAVEENREDGIAGLSDDEQRLCLAVAMWNGHDPILKERFSGPTDHGENIQERYAFLDNTPTHAYQRMLYSYPQRAVGHEDVAAVSRDDADRCFDVFVEYAKATPDDILLRITVHNRGPEPADLRLLPTLWFRNTWAERQAVRRPVLRRVDGGPGRSAVRATHNVLGDRWLACLGEHDLLFTENETENQNDTDTETENKTENKTENDTAHPRDTPDRQPFVKDAIDRYVVHGDTAAVNPMGTGTRVAVDITWTLAPGGSATARLRLANEPVVDGDEEAFDALVERRRAEADEFYRDRLGPALTDGRRRVVRQALARMLWSKRYVGHDVERSPTGRKAAPDARNGTRLRHDIVAMPDTSGNPWFATWDLALHAVTFGVVDVAFAKGQLDLLLNRRHRHPGGRLPAYDVNPPVYAWAACLLYDLEKNAVGRGDRKWLENAFHKLAGNFTWWVNRRELDGRGAPLPTDNAASTAWMALYCQAMLQIAVELAADDPVYVEQAQTFLEHLVWTAVAVDNARMWDEDGGFFHDAVRRPDGGSDTIPVRSIAGLLPLAAATVIPADLVRRYPRVVAEGREFVARHAGGGAVLAQRRTRDGHCLLAVFDERRLRRILARMLDESEFLGPHGIRAPSRRHEASHRPVGSGRGTFRDDPDRCGPICFPANALLIRALLNLHVYYGDELTVECPTGSGVRMTLVEVARDIFERLSRNVLPDDTGQDVDAAAHNAGRTGLVAVLGDLLAGLDRDAALAQGSSGNPGRLSGPGARWRERFTMKG